MGIHWDVVRSYRNIILSWLQADRGLHDGEGAVCGDQWRVARLLWRREFHCRFPLKTIRFQHFCAYGLEHKDMSFWRLRSLWSTGFIFIFVNPFVRCWTLWQRGYILQTHHLDSSICFSRRGGGVIEWSIIQSAQLHLKSSKGRHVTKAKILLWHLLLSSYFSFHRV